MTNKRHLGDDEGLGRVQGFSVVVVDDDAIVRAWVRDTLEAAGISLIGEAATEAEGLQAVQRLQPDVLLTAYRLPDRTGIELMLDLKAYRLDVTWRFWSPNSLRRGSTRLPAPPGFTVRSSSRENPGRLSTCWVKWPPGAPGSTPHIRLDHPDRRRSCRASASFYKDLVARGSTNRQIASELAISDETVKTLLARTYTKLGVVDQNAAAVAVG